MNKTLKAMIILSALVLFTAGCAPKQTWVGQNITLQVNIEPKEDFVARGYVVVAYTKFAKGDRSKDVYRFEGYKNNKLERVIECLPWGALKALLRDAVNPERYQFGICESWTTKYMVNSGMEGFSQYQVKVHKYYKNLPDYEKIKDDVIQVLGGYDLENEE